MKQRTSGEITIALAGNPNAGKTSLFNQLTGARAHVGNYPGVTVEKKEGRLVHQGRDIRVVDLPGTYSLTAYSLEELVARRFIIEERPDLVVEVVDAANLDRNLYLALQFMEIGVPVVIALNMIDVAESRGLKIDAVLLGELLGVPVIPTVARAKKGVSELLDAVVQVADQGPAWKPMRIRYGSDLDLRIAEITGLLEEGRFEIGETPARWLAVKALEGDQDVMRILDQDPGYGPVIRSSIEEVTRHLRATVDDEPEGVIADHRYGFITSVTKQVVTVSRDIRRTVSDKVDMVVLNRLVGPLFLLTVLYLVYQFTFWLGDAPVGWFEAFFGWLSGAVENVLPDGPVRSLIVSGIIGGVGGVIGFTPLIAFMFFAIAILEDTGYLARIAFMMDRVLRTFGLHGNSVLSLIVGGGISGGCAVPGVMAARTLRDPKERLATILVTPFMNCGAKLPLYAVLIGAFFSRQQALMMFLLTLISWGMALSSSRLLRWTLLKGSHTAFVMELPPYRLPTLKGLLIHTWERVWQYVKKAGTIILAVSVLLWAMMTYPSPPEDLARVFDFQRQQAIEAFRNGPAAGILPDEKARADFRDRLAILAERPEPVAAGAGANRVEVLAATVALLDRGRPLPDELASYAPAARAYIAYRDASVLIGGGEAQARLKYSLAGRLGGLLERATRPLGFDWRTNIALTGGFAAKEVVVSTLGTAYSLAGGGEVQKASLSERLAREPGWNPLTAFTLMLFVMLYSPCFATVIIIGREAGWRWAMFSMAYATALAYGVSLIVSVTGRALGLGT
ncbi:MAG: ferrous iron transport protein B [Proteobacteria bacterium]|nr:ferrous iron transport protein B [Pseudomonadota bacterium]